MKTWLVWEAEYPDEGSVEIEAETLVEAFKKYVEETGEVETELAGEELTVELLLKRRDKAVEELQAQVDQRNEASTTQHLLLIEALSRVRASIQANATDTLWMVSKPGESLNQTVVDFITETIGDEFDPF